MDISSIKGRLVETINPDRSIRRKAQQELLEMQQKPEFCNILLLIVQGKNANLANVSETTAQHAATIYLKNYIKKGYNPDESTEENKISDVDREFIKQNLVNLMCQLPRNLMVQLSEAVRLIGEVDFPYNWKNLIPEIKSKLLSTQDFNIINGMLETLNTLFKMFREAQATDELWLKLKYVLEELQSDLLSFFVKATDIVRKGFTENNSLLQQDLLSCIRLLCRIFFSLNWQTIPEFYEDNMQTYMANFDFYLSVTDYADAKTKLKDVKSFELWLRIQAAVIQNLKLYAEKYDEEFQPVIGTFTEKVWNLLTKCSNEDGFDEVVAAGLSFLSSVVSRVMNKNLFSSIDVLRSVCDKIVLSNLSLRDYDQENFEFNPVDFIRGDIEGGDKFSRRKTTISLARAMCKNFEKEVTDIALQTISSTLSPHTPSGAIEKLMKINSEGELESAVKQYDVCITLFIAVAAKSYSFAKGVSEMNPNMDLISFAQNVILPILDGYDSISGKFPENIFINILMCDCLKFILVFRNQLNPGGPILGKVIQFLKAPNFVVSCYSAITLERILGIKNATTKAPIVTFQTLQPYLGDLLTSLFGVIEKRLVEENEYNEYAMKTIMRILTVAKENLNDHKEVMLDKLYNILLRICPNPQNPSFNHYLFECLAATITYSTTAANVKVETIVLFEEKLFPLFQQILTQDVSELMSYVFQLMAQLLEASALIKRTLPDVYVAVFNAVLAPVLWRDKSNQQVLVRLLNAFLREKVVLLTGKQSLQGLLGVFQKLMATNSTESQALKLLSSVISFVDYSLYEEFLKTIFEVIFTKYQSKKSNTASKLNFCVFFAILVSKIGLKRVYDLLENMFNGLFLQTITQLYIPSLEKVQDSIQRKACVIGSSIILTQTPGAIKGDVSPQLQSMGKELLMKVVLILSDAFKVESAVEEAAEFLSRLEETGYSAGYSKLAYSKESKLDPFQEVGNEANFLAKSLSEFSRQNPNCVQKFALESLQSHQAVGKNKVNLQESFTKIIANSGMNLA